MKILFILVGVAVVVLVAWRLFASPRPAHPPLTIGYDDPEMKGAMAKAQDTVPEFRRLYALSAIGNGRAAPPAKTRQGKSSINASAKIFMPRASG
jgi:hypothetical protein